MPVVFAAVNELTFARGGNEIRLAIVCVCVCVFASIVNCFFVFYMGFRQLVVAILAQVFNYVLLSHR